MKIKVACDCGSTFQAPEHLGGQTVKCPSCGKPITVPPAPASAPPPVPSASPSGGLPFDENDLSALEQPAMNSASASGSTAGRTAINQASRSGSTMGRSAIRDSPGESGGISKEVDDRMTRMYEIYSGKQMRLGGGSGGKLKLLIGLGIAVVVIAAGLGVGWQVLKTQYQPALKSVGSMIAGESGQPGGGASVEPAKPVKTQHPDVMVEWSPSTASQVSGVALLRTVIDADASVPGKFTFKARLVPASKANDRRLNMSTSVLLYRALNADGPFTQADRVTVEDYDASTGAISFELFDAAIAGLGVNQLYYRLSGLDSEGKRLFDTPAAVFPLVSKPTVKHERLTWSPLAEDQPIPAMRVAARLDASGWDGVFLWQMTAAGPINQLLPDLPRGLPVVIESSVFRPTEIELDAKGLGAWRMRWVSDEIDRRGRPGAPVVGAAPYLLADGLDLRLTPNEQAFASVSRSSSAASDGVGRSVTLSFTPEGESAASLTVTSPPVFKDVTATAYDGRVYLSWDSAALRAGLDRYDGEVAIAVRRYDDQGRSTLIAELSPDSRGYTDTALPNGHSVYYQVSLIPAGVPGAVVMARTDAWVRGHGKLAVLAAYPVAQGTVRVIPEPGLARLNVSLGANELSYPGTGIAAAQLCGRLTEALANTPGVVVVDRAAMQGFVCADRQVTLSQALAQVGGSPAQVQVRLVDSTTGDGEHLALWVTDVASGETTLLAEASVDETVSQAGRFVTALRGYLKKRVPDVTPTDPAPGRVPRQVVVGPIYPVDQSALYYGSDRLAEQLAHRGDQAHKQIAVVTRAFWLKDTQQPPEALMMTADAVLVTGRVWNNAGRLPSVCLHAVEASTGRLIDRFTAEQMNPQALRDFAQWCGGLRVSGGSAPDEMSPLLRAERSLAAIHPVWRQMASDEDVAGAGMSLFGDQDSPDEGLPRVSFGVPEPPSIIGLNRIVRRDQNHPLCVLQPYIAPQHPLVFDRWAQVYADYIEADFAAFIAGFEQIRRIQQVKPGPFRPYLIIRGEHMLTGSDTVPAGAGAYRVNPVAMNVRGFFPRGSSGQPMIDYRRALSQRFQAWPWASYHAWKQVDRAFAEPFFKGELFGVREGTYDRLIYPERPAPLATYIAAKLLANTGNKAALAYQQKARGIASKTLAELTRGGTGERARGVTDALLVLAFERDPVAIERLQDKRFRKRYLKVQSQAQTDVLRMLVDQVGPQAWDWADQFDSVDWSRFLWRSPQELDQVVQAKAGLVPDKTVKHLQDWWNKETGGQDPAGQAITATGPGNADPVHP